MTQIAAINITTDILRYRNNIIRSIEHLVVVISAAVVVVVVF